MTGQPGERLRCPKCGKLLCVAYVPAGGWVESMCKSCRHLVIFTPDAPPVVLPSHGKAGA